MALETQTMIKKCEFCGKEFETDNPRRKYCITLCDTKRQPKQCVVCGKTFIPDKIYQPYQKYCGQKCRRKETDKNYMLRHPGYGTEKARRYRLTEPGKISHRVTNKISDYKRRAKLEKGDLTTTQLKEIENKYEECVFCRVKAELTKEHKLTNDHIISVDDDGENTKYNITRSCRSCNSSRQERDVFWWCNQKGLKVPDIVIFLLKKQLEEKRFVPKNIEEILNKI